MNTITEAELREQYARTGLEAARGIPFERAIESAAIRLALEGGIRARRLIDASRAQDWLHVHHANQEAA